MAPRFPAAAACVAALLLLAPACGGAPLEFADGHPTPAASAAVTARPTAGSPPPGDAPSPGPADGSPAASPIGEESDLPAPPRPSAPEAAAAVGANELGAVPVIMYHRVLPGGGGDYDLTPEEFRAELERLYDEGYRPIRAVDLARGSIDVPAGTTPVVLTFDDGSREQFAYDEDGEVAADTAIGMLLAFADEHPDFSPVASVYVNAAPFGGGSNSAEILVDLHERGFELGNHSHGHAHLGTLEEGEVRRELAHGAAVITDAVPGAEVATVSLPFGVWPQDRSLAVSGTWGGSEYAHEGILLVGAGPAPSPFHTDFDPLAIPRIRTSPSWAGGEPDYGSAFWLDWLRAEPGRRYVSDGDPDTVAFPESMRDQLDPRHTDRALGY